MVSILGVERGHLHGSMLGVVCKFSEGNQIVPIVLLIMTEDAEILLENLIDAFGLTVGLRMVCRREIAFDIAESQECSSKCGSKLRSPIGNNVCRKTMDRQFASDQ